MRELPKCGNALSMERGTVTCGLGLYGGTPHIGVCNQCKFIDKNKNVKVKKHLTKVTPSDIQYQEEVLDRMVKRGCKSCEKKRQEQYIQRLKNESN